jgi:hypothetical protein
MQVNYNPTERQRFEYVGVDEFIAPTIPPNTFIELLPTDIQKKELELYEIERREYYSEYRWNAKYIQCEKGKIFLYNPKDRKCYKTVSKIQGIPEIKTGICYVVIDGEAVICSITRLISQDECKIILEAWEKQPIQVSPLEYAIAYYDRVVVDKTYDALLGKLPQEQQKKVKNDIEKGGTQRRTLLENALATRSVDSVGHGIEEWNAEALKHELICKKDSENLTSNIHPEVKKRIESARRLAIRRRIYAILPNNISDMSEHIVKELKEKAKLVMSNPVSMTIPESSNPVNVTIPESSNQPIVSEQNQSIMLTIVKKSWAALKNVWAFLKNVWNPSDES